MVIYVQDAPLYDYGKLYQSVETYGAVYPQTVADVQSIVTQARQDGTLLRVRASGHTLNGASLPRNNKELLVRMQRVDHYRFEEPGTITVGTGALLWDVRDFVSHYGLRLPVYNGGWGGPTVGGFMCSGGMGLRRRLTFAPPGVSLHSVAADSTTDVEHESLSELHGGFWENVLSVTLVDGRGEVHTLTPADESFKWLFGSFGQLGIFIEAKLQLLPGDAQAAVPYPLGLMGTIPKVQPEDLQINDLPPPPQGLDWLYWFSYLVSPAQEQAVWDALGPLIAQHRPHVRPTGGWVGPVVDGAPIGYRYLVRYKRFHPPLLYPYDEDFLLTGFMAVLGVGTPQYDDKTVALEKDFVDLARRHNFKLYLQAENLGLQVDFKQYYGDSIYQQFQQLKDTFDPYHLYNRGVFFPADVGQPQRASHARLFAALFRQFLP
jgi:FAD/FMN-containing dehydrogenase